MKHDFANGKYTVIHTNGKLTALRNGEPWVRALFGDNLVYWMLVEVDRLKQELAASQSELASKRVALTDDDIRKAGGIVHRDGNIFFTNIAKLNAAIEAHITGEKTE